MGGEPLQILQATSMAIDKGDSLAIVGASGSGKSTLLGLLAGLDLPTKGNIRLAGHMITDLSEDQRAAVRLQHVGFVFQSFQLMPNLTALENVMLPLELQNAAEIEAKARQILDRVGLAARLQHYPKQLSGGEQQRVALARAFITEPTVLFADEPTGNLDSHTGERIADLLFQLNQEKQTTLVLVTHDKKLASRCQQLITLEAGKIVTASEAR
ncbi:MAG TPA: ATP-binding cassette domain-containing protein [Pseudomonadales bacterium]